MSSHLVIFKGWDGEGDGSGVQDGEHMYTHGVQDGQHMYTHGWFKSMYGKTHYNIVISLQLK